VLGFSSSSVCDQCSVPASLHGPSIRGNPKRCLNCRQLASEGKHPDHAAAAPSAAAPAAASAASSGSPSATACASAAAPEAAAGASTLASDFLTKLPWNLQDLGVPLEAFPTSKPKGQHSYTVISPTGNGARVEVQLKNKCFFLKAVADGQERPNASPVFGWAKYKSAALAWESVKLAVGWCNVCAE
jgi:hypothetical protein